MFFWAYSIYESIILGGVLSNFHIALAILILSGSPVAYNLAAATSRADSSVSGGSRLW